VGAARRGPTDGSPELLTSYADFARIYGGASDIAFDGKSATPNYLALAVRQYFDNGGARLYVRRVFLKKSNASDGIARVKVGGSTDKTVHVTARFPGSGGNGTVTFTEVKTPVSEPAVAKLPDGSVIELPANKIAVKTSTGWVDNSNTDVTTLPTSTNVLTLSVEAVDADGTTQRFDGLGYHEAHKRFVGSVLSQDPKRRSDFLENLYWVEIGGGATWVDVRTHTSGASKPTVALTSGNDGKEPTQAEVKTALERLAAIDDISIIAAPGSSALTAAAAIRTELITHADQRDLYRVAVLDTAEDDTVSTVPAVRGAIDSDNAALYFPWITIANPSWDPSDATSPQEVNIPPSGAVCGIYARNDIERGVWKSPANEVVLGALRFSDDISFREQESLNPKGINCLRFFPGRGYRVWGARTASSDPEFKYLSVRRYFNYLKASIERGTQWAVFEPNGEALWANVTDTIDSFLYNEWRQGALLGASPKEAYFVRCDRTTMTQNDLDNGRMVCLIGVAVVKPAEFVIFRIGQKTASARD